jgi:hypothetical protein
MNKVNSFSVGQRRLSLAVCLSILVSVTFLLPNAAWGQGAATASLGGTVKDSSGAVVPGAQVTITQTNTGISQTKPSAADGTFIFPLLPVGPYKLEVKKEGFGTYEQTGIVLTVSQAAQVPVSLEPKALKEVITVTGTASPVDTTTATLSNLVERQQVVGLPLQGRNPAEFVLLAAGVSNPMMNTRTNGTSASLQFAYPAGIGSSMEMQGAMIPAIDGMRSGGVYYALDGANNTDPYAVTGGPFPNPDAVQEFRVVTSGYGPEYISAPGGVVNIVTKSGTNNFHGNVFEFLRNSVVNARNYFAAKTDDLKRSQFGGTAGGPIVKNKLFIFGSYQGTAMATSAPGGGGRTQFVLTDAQRNGNFSGIGPCPPVNTTGACPLKSPYVYNPADPMNPSYYHYYTNNLIPLGDFSPITSQLIAMLPHSTAADGRVEVITPQSVREDQGTLKVDYVAGKHSLITRYFVSDYRGPAFTNPTNMLQDHGGSTGRWQDAMIGYNYASSGLVNEFRATYQRNRVDSTYGLPISFKSLGAAVSAPTTPWTEFIQVSAKFIVPGGAHGSNPRNTYMLSDRVSLIRGRHQLSVGAETVRIQNKSYTDHFQSGVGIWAGLPPFYPFDSGNILANFVLGKVTLFAQGDGIMIRTVGTLWGFHVGDQIRVTPRLTLSLGLRYDPYWPFHALHGRMTCWHPGQQSTVFPNSPPGLVFAGDAGCDASGTTPDLHTFQPRIGFAYRLDEKGNTSLRAAYGIYTIQQSMQSFQPMASTQPWVNNQFRFLPYSISNPWLGTLPFFPNFPGGDPFASRGFAANDAAAPSNYQFVLPIQEETAFSTPFKLANVQKWNLTLEHLFRGNIMAQVSYVGTKGTHLNLNEQGNAAQYIPGMCGDLPCSNPTNIDARRPLNSGVLGSMYIYESALDSSYNALQIGVERRMGTGLTVSSHFTWAKAIDYLSSNAVGNLAGNQNVATNPYNVKSFRAVSDFDAPYMWNTAVVWQAPAFKNQSFFLLKHVLSNWQVTGIWSWQAGMPFSIYSGVDNSYTGVGQDYADMVPGVSPYLDPNRPRGEVIAHYFNSAAFTQNAAGTFGNAPRNLLRGPGFNNVDMGLQKTFPITERYKIQFRAEFFNLTNTPHLQSPGGVSGPVGPASVQFSQIIAARDPRIIQFALKFEW